MIGTVEKCDECGATYYLGDEEGPYDHLCPQCREPKEGTRVVLQASDEAIAGIAEGLRTKEFDFTVTAARLTAAGTGPDGPYAVISWETKSAGFGELTFHHKDGQLHIDTEAMSQRFVAEVLVKLLEGATYT